MDFFFVGDCKKWNARTSALHFCKNIHIHTSVFKLNRKYPTNSPHNLEEYLQHDRIHHSGVDMVIGGIANPLGGGLYFVEVILGTPPKKFYLQIDTGSSTFWINCSPCLGKECSPEVKLNYYDIQNSSSATPVTCHHQFCDAASGNENCHHHDQCSYTIQYGDGSSSSGYLVEDILQYNEVVRNRMTQPAKTKITFGCGLHQRKRQTMDGILGLGQEDTSLVRQLASSIKTPNVFAHCLDGDIGGGVLVIGQVADRDLKLTPLVPNKKHYTVKLEGIDVAGVELHVNKSFYDAIEEAGTIIDSGTTFSYLPEPYYTQLINSIMAAVPNLNHQKKEDAYYCFYYNGSIDEAFPVISLNFVGSVSMKIYPHEYLFFFPDKSWCIGWLDSGSVSEKYKYMVVLGDSILKNKLIVYNLDKKSIGWKEYDCSSSVLLQDGKDGTKEVAAHHLDKVIIGHPISKESALKIWNVSVIFASLLTFVLLRF